MEEQTYTITFSQSSYDYLCEAAIDQGVPIAEVVANALALEKWMREESRAGAIFLLSKDGVAQEIRFK